MAGWGSPENPIPLPEVVVTPYGNGDPNGAHFSIWNTGHGAGVGGIADAGFSASGYQSVISGFYDLPHASGGGGTVESGGLTSSDQSHYYSGYWAGVQGALYGFGPPEATPIHSYGFVVDPLGLSHQGIPSSSPAALIGVTATHPMELWLTPDSSSWDMGSGADEWPADVPDWGMPTPMPGTPMRGSLNDFQGLPDSPTEQEIVDAGNPLKWLSQSQVGPRIPALSYSGPGPDDMTPVPDQAIPSTVPPGNVIPGSDPILPPSFMPTGQPTGNLWLRGLGPGAPLSDPFRDTGP